jgi:cell division ATPase FtsA
MNIFISMSPEQILFRIEETVRKFFHFENMKFSSFLLSSFTIVRDMYTNQNGFLLIDIGGEVTDISMIKKAILCESISFPLGSNFIIRRIAFTLGCTFGEAESLFFLLKDEHADLATEEKMKPIIEKLKKEWLQSFQESLVNISNDISIPATIYLTVDKTFASFFAKVIENEQFNQYTLTESKFKIVFLDTETLHGIATFGDNTIRDQFMIVNAVYINRFLIKI